MNLVKSIGDTIMKKIIIILLSIISFTAKAQKEPTNKTLTLAESRKKTEIGLSQAIQGTPLVIPLPEESDPTLFLMPVSNDKSNLVIDRLYLIDGTQEVFIFDRDIYQIKCVKRIYEDKNFYLKYIVIATSNKRNTQHEFEIDGYMYHQIWKINNEKWEYPSNIKIPVITIKQEHSRLHMAEK